MTADDIRKQLEPWIRSHTRSAWVPVLGEGQTSPTGSRFGGGPWIPAGTEHPQCGRCNEPLRLVLQLELASLPAGAHGHLPKTGLLQVLYCANRDCEGEAQGYSAFSDAHLVRTIAAGKDGEVAMTGEPFPARSITGWTQLDDVPHAEEQSFLGLKMEYNFPDKQLKVSCPEVGLDSGWIPLDTVEAEDLSQSREGDKLRGWPYWVQGVEYPACTKCQQPMEFLLQIESEKGVPYMWGDAGVVYVLQCPRDPTVLTMFWQSA